ncbi:MAG: GAF domain-containing protein [Deltaproteobacteria bacterium]|nr:GAF domain-containing protein [Deltaproteobacteria bacterium]
MDPQRELQEAVELLADLTEAHTVALYLFEPEKDHLKPVAWHTLSRCFRAHDAVRVGEGLVGYVAKHGQLVDVDRYQQNSTVTRLYNDDEGIKAFLAVPVATMGVLVVDTKTRRIFGEREKKVIKDFARFFANLVRHQVTWTREACYGRILDLLYEVENASLGYNDSRAFFKEILEAGRRFTGLSLGFICLLLPGRKKYMVEAVEGPSLATLRGRSFPLSHGLVGWVFREGRVLSHGRLRPLKGKSYLFSPEETIAGYNTFVGVPLLAWRRFTGVWGYAGNTERYLEEEEERALQLAGHRVAATIEHYHLLRR